MRSILLVCLILFTTTSCVTKDKYESALSVNALLQDEIDELQHKIDVLQDNDSNRKNKVYELETKVEDLRDKIEELEEDKEILIDIIGRAKRACYIWDNDAYIALRILNEY
jgi:peptidoglycan hydrolase CwlO-like protein